MGKLFRLDRPALLHRDIAGITRAAAVFLHAGQGDFADQFFVGEHHIALVILDVVGLVKIQLVAFLESLLAAERNNDRVFAGDREDFPGVCRSASSAAETWAAWPAFCFTRPETGRDAPCTSSMICFKVFSVALPSALSINSELPKANVAAVSADVHAGIKASARFRRRG